MFTLLRYFIIYKPYKMISQFVSPYEQRLLGDLDFEFPEGTHAVGRLDDESEGLLILTTDKTLTQRLLHPAKKHLRVYLVQVKKQVEAQTLENLRNGLDIVIKRKGAYKTQACEVSLIDPPTWLPARNPAVEEFEKHSWLEFTLTEGKNRQIRKMCAAVKHKCKRLIRTKIEDLDLADMQPGEVREMDQQKLFALLKL
ncbi:MAG: pseudouridine synthase [Bacteroidota bacterium]